MLLFCTFPFPLKKKTKKEDVEVMESVIIPSREEKTHHRLTAPRLLPLQAFQTERPEPVPALKDNRLMGEEA